MEIEELEAEIRKSQLMARVENELPTRRAFLVLCDEALALIACVKAADALARTHRNVRYQSLQAASEGTAAHDDYAAARAQIEGE